jgi:polyprenyl P-hydroxybenzoate/phenylacrylic acid decarboxylase-like protein
MVAARGRPFRVVIAITGASGGILGVRLVEELQYRVETHVIVSRRGGDVISEETIHTADKVRAMGAYAYDDEDLHAPVASGSYLTDAMVVVPCSIKTLSAIAYSRADTLVARAADVMLKERRRLVLVVRESPLHWGHLDSMRRVTEMGAIVCPPVPAFYTAPRTIEELIDQSVGKLLDLLGLEHELSPRWGEGGAASISPDEEAGA